MRGKIELQESYLVLLFLECIFQFLSCWRSCIDMANCGERTFYVDVIMEIGIAYLFGRTEQNTFFRCYFDMRNYSWDCNIVPYRD